MQKVNLGGDRLGSGAKNIILMHGYSRSNHDLSYLWKSTMAPGTLVPFMVQVGLPGDTFDIDLESIVKTHPTVGPLFGSFKLQLDVFSAPIRLYNRILHNNKLGLGMSMKTVLLPQLNVFGKSIDFSSEIPPEFQQINQSSLLAYLGIRGIARGSSDPELPGVSCYKNAIPYLAYLDIFKNYYANKQEDKGYVIYPEFPSVDSSTYGIAELVGSTPTNGYTLVQIYGESITADTIIITVDGNQYKANEYLTNIKSPFGTGTGIIGYVKPAFFGKEVTAVDAAEWDNSDLVAKLRTFDLEIIDNLRDMILSHTGEGPFTIPPTGDLFSACLAPLETSQMTAILPQSGLLVKTYQSDLFNNWLNSEWISGSGSISEITAISTAEGSFTIDTLNLSKKVYDMLNRIATSGGSYEDWLNAVYDHNSKWRAETPVYHGGLSREIIFQEVISQSATTDEPLGSLAGKGIMSGKRKGGKVVINVDEPCFIMGIVSITPRIDYCQGNEWFVNLETLDDLHKPALDGIGFQDLTTDQMAFWDTIIGAGGSGENEIYFSAGKVPAWINYMTNYNKCFGNFADPRQQMFMTLARRYENVQFPLPIGSAIKDLTTYIDPSKFNYAFADTSLSAQNFWVQIACNIEARRKMSAKIIPNL